MIIADQPTCFPDGVLVRASSRDDGTVLDRAVGIHNPAIVTNRTRFCDRQGLSYGDVVYQRIIYDEYQTYDRIVDVDEHHTCKHIDEVAADALVTSSVGVGLLLPVADCVATVLYDPRTQRLALAHLGRHSTQADLMTKVLTHMQAQGSKLRDVIIWMAPAVQQASYRMEYFDDADTLRWRNHCEPRDGGYYLDLPGYNYARAVEAGVLPEHVHVSAIDTATNPDYFSHSQGDVTGRFAVLVQMKL
jgi:copper oxidase (laccase) domain-containing protein